MTAIVPFNFGDLLVRISTREGEPWFVLADVCRVLEIASASDAARRLDDDERQAITISDALGRPQDTTIINESGLYSLVLRSRKTAAKRFKKWVTSEVLPSIRRTGGYGVGSIDPIAALDDPASLRRLLLHFVDKVDALAPDPAAFHRLLGAPGSLCITDAAKALSVRPKELFDWLRANRWIYRRAGGRNYVGYQDKIAAGLIDHRVSRLYRADGPDKIVEQVLLTSKGLARLASLLGPASHPTPREIEQIKREAGLDTEILHHEQ